MLLYLNQIFSILKQISMVKLTITRFFVIFTNRKNRSCPGKLLYAKSDVMDLI
jgi:hypothetical protein